MASPITGDLADLFPDVVVWEKRTGVDGRGAATGYAAPQDLPAKVSNQVRNVRDDTGQERQTSVMVTLCGAFGVSYWDRFTLPERYSRDPSSPDVASRQPTGIAVNLVSDENGPHHEQVFF